MKSYKLNENNYELIKDYKDGFDYEELKNNYTDYFDNYDYILGDWSYGKLRLKGFCDKKNKEFKDINNIDKLDLYLKNLCSYECKYFLIKKI